MGGCGGGGGGATLTLVGYSAAREVYARLIPAFQATPGGRGVRFRQSYGASGEQSRAVKVGLDADVVALSLEPDVTRLVDAGLVDPGWNAGPDRGFVSNSVVVIITRRGNPEHITGWDDLVRPGIQVITPNPFTSGAAQWNIMAAYGAQIARGRSAREALAYVARLFANVPVQPSSGREALEVFESGKGDALISYENEAIAARRAGDDIDYVIPDQTILIQNPAAVVNAGGHRPQAEAFVRFLHSARAQRIFGEAGYRPVLAPVARRFHYPRPATLFTIDDLGGWPAVRSRFFDPDHGAITKIFQDKGLATS